MNVAGVIIARFQTPYLHDGHKNLLSETCLKHNKVIVVLGVSPVKGSQRNPFDFYTRERMIKQYDASIIILPLPDDASDKQWSANLDYLLKQTFPMESFVLYGSRDCFIPYYSGSLAVKELPETGNYSATSIRNANADKVRDTEDFRMGINYAYHNVYNKVYATVDIAVMNENDTMVLLGRKHHATKWRFPGGFSDPSDENFEAAAKRELREECGDIETGKMIYVGSAKIDDWRYRNEADEIITTFYKTKIVFGKPIGSDDLEEVKWMKINELNTMLQSNEIVNEHVVLINMFLKNIQPEY